MAIQFSHPASNLVHMFNTIGDYKDVVFSDRGNNPENSVNVDILPNLPMFQDYNMTNKSDADHVRTSELTDWTRKHPLIWTKKDVLDWLYCIVEQLQLDGSKFKGEAYRDFAGPDLCGMGRDAFHQVDPCYGTIIYDSLQCFLQQESLKNQKCTADSRRRTLQGVFNIQQCWIDQNNNDMNEDPCLEHPAIDDCDNNSIPYNSALTVLRSDNNDIKDDLSSLGLYPISQEFEFPSPAFNCSTLPAQPSTLLQHQVRGSSHLNSSSIPPWSLAPSVGSAAKLYPSFGKASSTATSQCTSSRPITSSSALYNVQMFPPVSSFPPVSPFTSHSASGSLLHRNSSTSTADSNDLGYSSDDSTSSLSFMPPMGSPQCGNAFCSDDMDVGINGSSIQKTQHETRKDVKRHVAAKTQNQLWKFVLELLRDPEANPRLLKWEDRNSGVFRFVQSEKVAQLWGKKKNNPQMTYEKMSRAMRFCRSIGYFSEIDKDGRFPKKLCFKFGIKSQGWKD